MGKSDLEFLEGKISLSLRAVVELTQLHLAQISCLAQDLQEAKQDLQRAKDENYLPALRLLLVELSKKISAKNFTLAQLSSVPLNLPDLVQQVDELYKASNNPKVERLIKDSADSLIRRKVALFGGLIALSKKIENLALITRDPELKLFSIKVIGFIRILSEEGIPIMGIGGVKDKNGSGGNDDNGSSQGGGGFPGPNPKLMSGNRSMPWHQPRYFLC